MNFTWELYWRADRIWGTKAEDGTANGMFASAARGDVDLVGTSITMRPYRQRAVDFLVSFTNLCRLTEYL